MVRIGLKIEYWMAEEPIPGDSWDCGVRDGSVLRPFVVASELEKSYRDKEVELELPLYVVVGEYSTGSTFGSDFEAEIVDCLSEEWAAHALAAEARSFTKYGNLSNGYRVPWNGYFERLKGVRIFLLDGAGLSREVF